MATPDLSDKLSAPQLAGGFLARSGLVKRGTMQASYVARAAGNALDAASAHLGKVPEQTDTPAFNKMGFLAVSEREVVLFNTKQGMTKLSITDELGRLGRDQIAATEFDPGLVSHLTLHLVGGGAWVFDIPRVHRKNAQQIADVLGAATV